MNLDQAKSLLLNLASALPDGTLQASFTASQLLREAEKLGFVPYQAGETNRRIILFGKACKQLKGVIIKDEKGREFYFDKKQTRRGIEWTLVPLAKAASEWIPVNREVPDSDTTVLVADESGIWDEPVWLGYHDGEAWYDVDGTRLNPWPSHWRHLPEPPMHEGSA